MNFDPARDQKGIELALREIFERELARTQIDREAVGANPETRARMELQIPQRTLSPGYYRIADHLLRLEAERKAGIGFSAGELAAFEAAGLVTLERARGDFGFDHPTCSTCGARQRNRFGQECPACGAKFRRKGNR